VARTEERGFDFCAVFGDSLPVDAECVRQTRICHADDKQRVSNQSLAQSVERRPANKRRWRAARLQRCVEDDLRPDGSVESGFIAGGKSYGYDIVKTDRSSNYQVNEEQAKRVRFIFEKFAAGRSTFQLCDHLNALGVTSPRISTWMRSALYGSPLKGRGILNNSAYIGPYIRNRSRWIKEPDTGARVRQDLPESDWKTEQRDHYWIVNDELWKAVRQRMGTDRLNAGTSGAGRPSRTLFGGLLRGPKCGGAMVSIDKRY
jgi:site-specific DNA recombinase